MKTDRREPVLKWAALSDKDLMTEYQFYGNFYYNIKQEMEKRGLLK